MNNDSPQSSIWVEVTYTVILTEQGKAIIKIDKDPNLDDLEGLLKAASETVARRGVDVMANKECIMRVKDITTSHNIERFYIDDGTGQPNTNSPIELELIMDVLEGNDGTHI